MFCYFVRRHSFHFLKLLESFGFNRFWINVFLWLPVRLAILELKIKYGSLENFLEHQEQRKQRNESAA